MTNLKIILASGSPRRKELLAQAGYDFDVCPSLSDEDLEPKIGRASCRERV